MQMTPYSEVNRLLEVLQAGAREVLGEKLVGLYLYGSTTAGDFESGVSDVDLLAAVFSDLDDADFEALRRMHADVARENPDWNDRVEVQYLSTDALRSFRSRRSPIAVISPGEPFNRKDAGMDWLMNWYLVREYGVTLSGPDPATVIPPITTDEFVQAVKEYAAWRADRVDRLRGSGSRSYAVITACRALYTVTHREHVSKRKAALWARDVMPEWASLIEQALRWRDDAARERHSPIDHDPMPDDTVRFVRLMADRVAKT